jgi:flavin-dependent dehydrogenase
MRRTTPLIVGGGPAGAAVGIRLAKAGVHPHILERAEGPHDVVCGGFLSWEALTALSELGVDVDTLGARTITRLRLITRKLTTELSLPRPAAGLSRRTLDAALLDAASEAGVRIERGIAVREVDVSARSVRLETGEQIFSEVLFLANGKHELRGAPRLVARERSGLALGLRATIVPSKSLLASLSGVLELHLFDGGYAGLLLQEDGEVNICISTVNQRLKISGGLDQMLTRLGMEQPLLGERLSNVTTGSWIAIANVPYGWKARMTLPGVFRVGDQAAVIASLAGDGVAIALLSGCQAATALLKDGADGALAFQQRFARNASVPLKVAGCLRWAAENGWARTPVMRLVHAMPSIGRLAANFTRISAI